MNEIAQQTESERPATAAVIQRLRMPAPASESDTLLAVLSRAASDPNVDIEKFERLMAMKERIEKEQERRDFNTAIAAAKAAILPAVRNKTGHNDKKYADFSAVAAAVDGPLSEHGLFFRFRTVQTPGLLSVTCILSHRNGHFEETTLSAAPDKSGSKNDIQALGSAQSYLMRYSLVGMIGLSIVDDDDGKAAGDADTISHEQVQSLKAALDMTNTNIERFLTYFKIEALPDMPLKRFDEAMAFLKRKAGAV